jgi:hypothetical protein
MLCYALSLPLIHCSNIFAVEPRQLYTSSPRADRAARQGLGGFQGLLVLGGVCGVIAVATLGLASSPADTLQVRLPLLPLSTP